MQWPEGNEAMLRSRHGLWSDHGEVLRALRDDMPGLARSLGDPMTGSAATTYADLVRSDLPAVLEALAGVTEELAMTSMNAAADIQKTKVTTGLSP
ncbi:hypothetical protein AB0283_26920 [Micromonospora vinacea]|uniref:WXG100-like domain-containing protein n=1 Tax=Micromonospora vinacea TaxID=709878 RepID=UPI00344ECAA4